MASQTGGDQMRAQEIAKQALEDELAPGREAEQARAMQKAAEDAQAERRQAEEDQVLLEQSGIKDWFPGVEWKVIAHWRGTVFQAQPPRQPGEIDPDINLRVFVENRECVVQWTPYEDWIDVPPAHKRGWSGPVVTSAADVGRQIQRHHDVMSSMPDHLP